MTGVEVFDSWNIKEGNIAVVNYSLFTQLAKISSDKVAADKKAAEETGI